MRLMTGLKTLVSMALAAFALLGVAHQASAGVIFSHATACQTYYNQPANGLLWGVDGLRNSGTSARYVICSVPRASAGGNYAFTWVEGVNYNGAQTSCTVYSMYSGNGQIYSAKSFTTAASTYSISAYFTSAEMPYAAYVSVLCYMPPNNTGVLKGLVTLD